MDYQTRLVECAKSFRAGKPDANNLPLSYASESQAFDALKDILLLDAHYTLQEPIPRPEKAILNALDLTTEEPGIATGETIFRGDSTIRPVTYERKERPSSIPLECEPRTLTTSRVSKLIDSAQERANKSLKQQEEKAEYDLSSAEDKKAIRERRREEKAARQRSRQEKKGTKGNHERDEIDGKEEPNDGTEGHNGMDEHDASAPSKEKADVENQEQVPSTENAEKRQKKEIPEEKFETAVRAQDTIRQAKSTETQFFESPATHDRALLGLTQFGLHADLQEGILQGKNCDSIVLIDGPPGTGKTTALLDELSTWLDLNPGKRALVCSPTNIGACDLYSRAFSRQMIGALALSKEHMPPHIPRQRISDLAHERIIFCTVAGRNGPKLVDQEFSAVFLDEGAQLIEAHAFGLFRPGVQHFCMAGDIAQLPGQVSKEVVELGASRSLMDRLIQLGMGPRRLSKQYRMHDEILSFPNRAFYDGRLCTAPDRNPGPESISPYQVCFVDSEERRIGTSYENEKEASRAISMANELKALGLHVCILAPYQAQIRRLQSARSGIPVSTIDAYQGHECDAIVLSITRTSDPGFWADQRRLVVALTRAKFAMRVIMHPSWSKDNSPLGQLAQDAHSRFR